MVDCQFLAFIKNPVKNVHQTATFSTNWPDVFEYCAPLDCRYCKNKWKVSVVFLAKIRYQTILYSAEATILDKINGKFTPLPPPLISPQNQGWKMGSFGFCPASSLIWGGGGGKGVCCSISFCPRLVSKKIASIMYSRLQITRTFKGNRKKVRVIGSSSYRDPEENSRE